MSRAEESGSPPPELELAPGFPGLEDDGRGPYVDHQGIREVISRLHRELDALRGSPLPGQSATESGTGTVPNVAGRGHVTTMDTGTWEVASNYGYNTARAYEVLNGSYGDLLEIVQKWAEGLERALANYERGEVDSSA
jgi:hypothetical protein